MLNMTAETKSALRQLIEDIKTKFTSKSVAALPSNYEAEYLQTSFAGIREALDFLYESLASVSRIPQSVIKGSAAGELASAQADKRDYHEFVKSEYQIGQLDPLIRWMTDLFLWERKGQIRGKMAAANLDPNRLRMEIEFNPIHSPNALEDAQIKLLDVQRLSIEMDKQITGVEQAQKQLYPNRELEKVGEFDLDQLMKELNLSTEQLTGLNLKMPELTFAPKLPGI